MPIRDEQKAATRSRILDAAALLIAARGADAASIDAIAAEAGVTSGAIYASFRNKAELLLTVVRERAVPLPSGPVPDMASQAARAVDDFGRQNPVDAGLFLQLIAAAARDEQLRETLASGISNALVRLEERIDQGGITAPLTAADSAALVQVVTAGLLALRPVLGDEFAQGLPDAVARLLFGER